MFCILLNILLYTYILLCPIQLLSVDLNLLNKKLFSLAYKENAWGDPNTRSGTGSSLRETVIIRQAIPALLKALGIKKMLDAPCGDFYWMKEIDLFFLDEYIGGDIVPDAIDYNNATYANKKRSFKVLDIVNDPLPRVDFILCRDCLQHLPIKQVCAVINNFKKSKSTYLLVSNYPKQMVNIDIEGQELFNACRMRPRNLRLASFNFPEPLAIIEEGFEGKVLTLWKLDDLPNFDIH